MYIKTMYVRLTYTYKGGVSGFFSDGFSSSSDFLLTHPGLIFFLSFFSP